MEHRKQYAVRFRVYGMEDGEFKVTLSGEKFDSVQHCENCFRCYTTRKSRAANQILLLFWRGCAKADVELYNNFNIRNEKCNIGWRRGEKATFTHC